MVGTIALLMLLQAHTATIGYLVTKDTPKNFYVVKTAQIEVVRQMCDRVDVDSALVNSNHFEFDNGVVHYYVERKRIVGTRNGELKLRRIR